MDRLLYRAARSGEISFLETLTADEETMYFSQLTPKSNTFLHVAADFKQADFFEKACLKCSPSLIWQPNSKCETVLHVAARVGCVEIVEFLIVEASVSPFVDEQGRQHNVIRKKNNVGDTALHCAVRNGQYYVAECLLNTDPVLSSFCNYADESPLYLAASHNYFFLSLTNLIIRSSPSSFSHMGPNGLTVLHELACYRSVLQVTEDIVSRRPELMKETDDILGWTPLHYASCYGLTESVELMMKYDLNSSAAYLLDHEGNSALHVAALTGNIGVVKALLQRCPDIFELTNLKGQTALHVAVLDGEVKVVEYILGNSQLGWILNEPDEDGNTPLHLAVLYVRNNIIELLARDFRIDLYATNNELKSAYDIFKLSFIENGYTKTKISSLLAGGNCAGFTQQYYSNVTKERLNRKPELKPYHLRKKESLEREGKSSKRFTEIYLVVATLVSTISFSIAFAVPGGYRSEGPKIGTPVLSDKAAFKAFYIFNIISLSSSLSAVFFQKDTAHIGSFRQRYNCVQAEMLAVAIIALALAYASGIYATLANSNYALATTPFVVFGFFVFLYFTFVMLDPLGGAVSGERIWRLGKYVIELKYGGRAGSPVPTFTYYIAGHKKHR